MKWIHLDLTGCGQFFTGFFQFFSRGSPGAVLADTTSGFSTPRDEIAAILEPPHGLGL